MVFKGIVLKCLPPSSLIIHPVDSAAVVKVDCKEDIGVGRFDLIYSLVTVYDEKWDVQKKCFTEAAFSFDEVSVEGMFSEEDTDDVARGKRSKRSRA